MENHHNNKRAHIAPDYYPSPIVESEKTNDVVWPYEFIYGVSMVYISYRDSG